MSNQDVLSGSLVPDDSPDPAETMSLLGRARKGDREALDRLLARYQDRVLRVVRIRLGARLRSWVESMDLVQATLAVAARKIDEVDIDNPGALVGWLAAIAQNQINDEADRRNAAMRDPDRGIPLSKVPALSGAHGCEHALEARDTLPEERAWKAELREILDDSVCRLAEDQREVVLLRDYCGGDWEAIARRLDRTVPATQELHRRAWIKVRRIARPRLGGIL